MTIDILVEILISFFVAFGFGIIFEVPKKYFLHMSIISALGRTVFIVLNEISGYSVVVSTFAAAFLIAALSHVQARVYKAPVTVFLIAGILPLVPGMGMYQSVSNFMDGLILDAVVEMVYTFMTAGAIAMAIFIVDSVFKVIKVKWPGM
ncbi:threonine/serine exporter family protein [Parasporobacterium paucivorans]|uniref:Uncharacterized membrane protein YjjB, DUF3815 family n=1 Tax=Parasporobacterium paucivorans DSM 15970 TaxID=1122934 RepID=A0A1M6FMX1_9FIRM|nr:threonine/serine exporter family protein [Parasporobacterium paucivorans]SHI98993.1 Uncharacterized membrane protein YjjB, DUF3815 family [Parasporobacterium paucivorans DSM 15970]